MKKFRFLFSCVAIAVLAIVLFWGFIVSEKLATNHSAPVITAQRKIHILYGDDRGGGHLHGVGKPCKSEFPQDWNVQEILSTVEHLAANDNLDWERQRNGYYVAESKVENVQVRVVVDRDRNHVITAYPVNVQRNPCPPREAANDND